MVAGKIYAFEECYNLAITDLCIDFVAINDLIALGICPLCSCLFLGLRYCYCHNNILWLFDSFRVLCKFFAHGACLKGEHCEFSHDWKDPPNNVKFSCSITFFHLVIDVCLTDCFFNPKIVSYGLLIVILDMHLLSERVLLLW